MKDEKKVAQLKALTVESSIDAHVKETIKRLDTAALDEKAKTIPGEQLAASIQADIDLLVRQFDSSHIAAANRRSELILALNQFVSYNFYVFFKKFDPHFADGTFTVESKFPAIKTILMIDQIGEILTITQFLKQEEDWNSLLNLMKVIEGHDVVDVQQFNAMITTFREIHTTRILELIVQYTLRNPVWHFKHSVIHETVGDKWLELKKAEAQGYILKLNNAKKNSQISALTKEIFESTELVRLDNYTVHISEGFRRKNVEHFLYAEGLNYLKAFLDDYVEKEIKELCEIIVIRGQWANNMMSREMSEALHALLELPPSILDLDTAMGEDGSDGSRLRAAMLRVDRDHTQVRYINSIVTNNNNEALEIIKEAAQELITIGKHLKNLIEDVQKKHPELLVNWREINLYSKEPLSQRMTKIFKKINYFVQLMHLCTQ